MDILRTAKKLEAGIARVLDGATRTAINGGPLEPLEIVHAVVDAAAAEVEPAGRGAHVFPFNRIKVSVAASSMKRRAQLAAVFDAAPSLTERIMERLRAAGCDASDLVVKIVYQSAAQADWTSPQWHADFAHAALPIVDAQPPAVVAGQPSIELTIDHHADGTRTSSFVQDRIDLGRCAEVRDGRNRLIRTNHVAFADEAGPINHSVSRRHAHIEFTASSGDYRLHDDRSAHGTSVLRNGRAIAVPSGARGIRLQSGDEIVLGEARVRVAIRLAPHRSGAREPGPRLPESPESAPEEGREARQEPGAEP